MKNTKFKNARRITFYCPKDLENKIKLHIKSQDQELSYSSLIRAALSDFLRQLSPAEKLQKLEYPDSFK